MMAGCIGEANCSTFTLPRMRRHPCVCSTRRYWSPALVLRATVTRRVDGTLPRQQVVAGQLAHAARAKRTTCETRGDRSARYGTLAVMFAICLGRNHLAFTR